MKITLDLIAMNENILKNFSKQFYRAQEAAKSISKPNTSYTLSFDNDNGLNSRLQLPEQDELLRLVNTIVPFADPSSSLYLRNIADTLTDTINISQSDRDKVTDLLAYLIKLEDGSVRLVSSKSGSLAGLELYLTFIKGDYFCSDIAMSKKLSELKSNPITYHMLSYEFYSYNLSIYSIAKSLFLLKKSSLPIQKPNKDKSGNKYKCIYCLCEETEFTTEEHVYPESLGNSEIILPVGIVCDTCNNNTLSQLDKELVEFPGISLLRPFFLHFNPKTGKFLSPKFRNMSIKKTHPQEIKILDSNGFEMFSSTEEGNFRFEAVGRTIFKPHEFGRSLYKIALGIIALENGTKTALNSKYDLARDYILGKSYFPNNLIMMSKCEPVPTIQGTHYLFEKGTFFELNIFGVIFYFNLENEPVLTPNDELKSLDCLFYSLEGE